MEQRQRIVLLAPMVVAAALFLPGIEQRILYIGDEARYALLARNMVETGDWLVPRIGAEVHLEKSPLFMWAIAAFSLVTGRVTELTSVLPAALSGIGGVGLTLVLGRRLFGPRAGLLAAFVLATTWGYYWHARLALADMMVTFFVVAAALAFWVGAGPGEARRGPMALFWVCLGLACSAKGPVGLMPLVAFGVFLIWEHGWPGLRRLRPVMGLSILAIVCSPWALAFALQDEQSYVQSVLIGDYLAPRLRGWRHASEVFFAFGPVGVGFLPWTPFLPAALWLGWRRADSADLVRRFRFLGCWVLAYVIVITLTPYRRDRYLLPVYPALALMIGWLWDRWARHPRLRALRIHGWLWGGISTAVAFVFLVPLSLRPDLMVLVPVGLMDKLFLVAIPLAGAAAVVTSARGGRVLLTFAAICGTLVLGLLYETRVLVTGHNRVYDIKSLAERLAPRLGIHDELVAYQYQHLALQFYTQRPVIEIVNPVVLRQRLMPGRRVYVVVSEREWPDFLQTNGRSWTIVDRAPLAGRTYFVATSGAAP